MKDTIKKEIEKILAFYKVPNTNTNIDDLVDVISIYANKSDGDRISLCHSLDGSVITIGLVQEFVSFWAIYLSESLDTVERFSFLSNLSSKIAVEVAKSINRKNNNKHWIIDTESIVGDDVYWLKAGKRFCFKDLKVKNPLVFPTYNKQLISLRNDTLFLDGKKVFDMGNVFGRTIATNLIIDDKTYKQNPSMISMITNSDFFMSLDMSSIDSMDEILKEHDYNDSVELAVYFKLKAHYLSKDSDVVSWYIVESINLIVNTK